MLDALPAVVKRTDPREEAKCVDHARNVVRVCFGDRVRVFEQPPSNDVGSVFAALHIPRIVRVSPRFNILAHLVEWWRCRRCETSLTCSLICFRTSPFQVSR